MATTLKCTRIGCGKEYPEGSTANSCAYHPGKAVFHDNLKSWDCCSDIPGHRPVLEFEEFMKIPGCTTGQHTSEKPKVTPRSTETLAAPTPAKMTVSKDESGKEVYTTATLQPVKSSTPAIASGRATPLPQVEEEEDDLDEKVPDGTKCKRSGCGKLFISDEESRTGDGGEAKCVYHPLPPLFREGSKGYLCCKPKVLEWEEFLKIQGCKTGKHVFVPKKKDPTQIVEEMVSPRIDHYQTPTQVMVSIYAKQVDKTTSSVKFESSQIHLDLRLPAAKRCLKTLSLFGDINPDASSVKYLGTKVDLVLVKVDSRSWTMLEQPAADLPAGFGFTFGVGGRTGTVGGKDLVLDASNQATLSEN